MKQRIEIRSLKRRDKKELSRLLRRQEGYDEFFSEEKDADTLAKAVAERSLSTCTFGEAAFVDGRMVGAIVGSRTKKRGILSKMREKFYYLRLKMKKRNRDALKCLSELEKMEKEMLKENRIPSSNLMSLFLMQRRYQNTQISETLLNHWEDCVKAHKNSYSYVVINGRREPGYLDGCEKQDEKYVMIQPKFRRFRFYKTLYRKNQFHLKEA